MRKGDAKQASYKEKEDTLKRRVREKQDFKKMILKKSTKATTSITNLETNIELTSVQNVGNKKKPAEIRTKGVEAEPREIQAGIETRKEEVAKGQKAQQ